MPPAKSRGTPAPDPRRLLPEESLDRLLSLTRLALADNGESGDLLTVTPVALPAGIGDDVVTFSDTAEPGLQLPSMVPPLPHGTRAFVLVPLRDAQVVSLEIESNWEGDFALCLAWSRPRRWTRVQLTALETVASSVAAEIQLRVALARQTAVAEDLRKDPLHDPQTELANRALFMDRLGMALMRSARFRDIHFAVLSISLNQFASIETSFGYDTAQEVLKELGNRLKGVMRNYDSVGRLSGDEFGVIVDAIRSDTDAARVANRVHESLKPPIVTRWEKFHVTASIGIVQSTGGVDSPARLIQLAALARENCRATGAAFEMFDPGMQKFAQSRLHDEMDLRRAVESDEFELHYQPIVSLSTGTIAHVEGLLRWRHAARGLLAAAHFINLAEETGLVVPLGWTALRRACNQLTLWEQQFGTSGGLSVSVNVTASQLKQDDVRQHIESIVKAAGIPPRQLNLEITERMLIGDPARAKTIVEELRKFGVGIHLDDFGTGYSSLHYLHELPLDAIKIDRAFVSRMDKGGRDAQVVVTIRELARQMGIPVIAEGVETEQQLAQLRELGCEYAQGYLFSKPLAPDDMAALLAEQRRW